MDAELSACKQFTPHFFLLDQPLCIERGLGLIV